MLYTHKSTIQIPYRNRKEIGEKICVATMQTQKKIPREKKSVVNCNYCCRNEENWTIDIHCNVGIVEVQQFSISFHFVVNFLSISYHFPFRSSGIKYCNKVEIKMGRKELLVSCFGNSNLCLLFRFKEDSMLNYNQTFLGKGK